MASGLSDSAAAAAANSAIKRRAPRCDDAFLVAEWDWPVSDKCKLYAVHEASAGTHLPFPRAVALGGSGSGPGSGAGAAAAIAGLRGSVLVVKEPTVHRQSGVHAVGRGAAAALADELVARGERVLVQELIRNPLTLPAPGGGADGCKFTMRCYVLVHRASGSVYLHRCGKLYHCLEPFRRMTRGALVTSGYLPEPAIAGFPYTFEDLRRACGDALYGRIWRAVERSIAAVAPAVVSIARPGNESCAWMMEALLLGADVEVDGDLYAWVLELNIGPDLEFKNEADRLMKTRVSDDLMDIAGRGGGSGGGRANGFSRVYPVLTGPSSTASARPRP